MDAAPVPATDVQPAVVYTVRPGDTLWRIAALHLDDPHRWKELAEANRERVQPDGRRLTDPDRIYVGWAVAVPVTRTGGAQSPPAARLVITARAWVGVPYLWGGSTRSGVDCSGLVVRVYAALGIDLPRTTYQQVRAGRAVTREELRPGDLVFPTAHHVQIYVGNGRVIESPRPGLSVREVPLRTVWRARRVI